MRPDTASSPSPTAMSSSSSWYDGGWSAGTSTWGFSFVVMARHGSQSPPARGRLFNVPEIAQVRPEGADGVRERPSSEAALHVYPSPSKQCPVVAPRRLDPRGGSDGLPARTRVR